MADLVIRHDEDRIAVLTLASPDNRNALSGKLLADLLTRFAEISAEVAAGADLHAVLLQAQGPAFCAGADLKEAATVDMTERARVIIAAERAIVACPLPVVARVEGVARAGGLGLIASCDLAVCREDVSFALTEVRLGLAASVISIPLRHRVPSRTLSDWLLTGRTFSADAAHAGGLVTHVAARHSIDEITTALLDDLRAGVPQGLRESKALATAGLLADLDERGEEHAVLSGRLFHSEIAQERMAAALRRTR